MQQAILLGERITTSIERVEASSADGNLSYAELAMRAEDAVRDVLRDDARAARIAYLRDRAVVGGAIVGIAIYVIADALEDDGRDTGTARPPDAQ